MGRLAEDMTRLCGEIVTLRGARESFVTDLRRSVASMRACFRRTHFEMARASKEKRLADVSGLRHAVASMKSGFRWSHANMARETLRGRLSFVAGLKKTSANMLHEYALDVEGAHRVWFGASPAEVLAQAAAERQAAEAHMRAEEEQRAREHAVSLQSVEAPAVEQPQPPEFEQQAAEPSESAEPEVRDESGAGGQGEQSVKHEHRTSGRKRR